MRFQAGRWVEDDGTPIDTATMQTASQGPGPSTAVDKAGDGGSETGGNADVRKSSPAKKDPRKNRPAQ